MDREHVVRSPHCPNKNRTCGECAWGFTTPGAGEAVPAGLAPLEGIPGYDSDCGRVNLFVTRGGEMGAVRNGKFFPGIPGNFAFERFRERVAVA